MCCVSMSVWAAAMDSRDYSCVSIQRSRPLKDAVYEGVSFVDRVGQNWALLNEAIWSTEDFQLRH